ncbi:MAG: LysM peptidoglycan-binding domain-containing protein, partial [Lacticaseibacillus absianus]
MKKKSLFMATLATISASGALFATSANANAAMDHKIVLNDTLWGLSKKYNVTIDALKKYNKLSSDTIYVGDTLKVPTKAEAALATAKTHRVVKGDTLWSLAKKYGTTVSALKKLNNLTSDTIYIGQTLILHANLNTYGVGGATISSNSSKAANDNAGYGAVSSTTTASVTTKQPEKSAKPAPAKKAEPKAKTSASTDTSAKKNAESTDSTKTDASTSANATTDYS